MFTFRAFDDVVEPATRVWVFIFLIIGFTVAMLTSFQAFPDMPKKTEVQLQRQVGRSAA